jgi:hypothetical protein
LFISLLNRIDKAFACYVSGEGGASSYGTG